MALQHLCEAQLVQVLRAKSAWRTPGQVCRGLDPETLCEVGLFSGGSRPQVCMTCRDFLVSQGEELWTEHLKATHSSIL